MKWWIIIIFIWIIIFYHYFLFFVFVNVDEWQHSGERGHSCTALELLLQSSWAVHSWRLAARSRLLPYLSVANNFLLRRSTSYMVRYVKSSRKNRYVHKSNIKVVYSSTTCTREVKGITHKCERVSLWERSSGQNSDQTFILTRPTSLIFLSRECSLQINSSSHVMMTPPVLDSNIVTPRLNNQLQYSWYSVDYLLYCNSR